MRTHRAGRQGGEPGRLVRAWRWLRSSGSYTGFEEDRPGQQPASPVGAQAKARLVTAALAQDACLAGRW
jgi:hypothetical protein